MKKQIRNAAAILLSAVLGLAAAGCQGGPAPAAPASAPQGSGASQAQAGALAAEPGASIEFTYWAGSPSDEQAWNSVFERFRQLHPEIGLETQVYPSDTYFSQLDTRIAGADWPDVMRYSYQEVGKFKEDGDMLDLTGMFSEEYLADIVPAYLSAMSYDGRLLGLPHHTDTIAVFYNKEMFERSGVRIPQDAADGWSWEELGQIAQKLKEDNGLDYAFAGIWENGFGYRFLPFMYMNGGALLGEDGKTIAVDSPQAKQALELYAGWRARDLVTKNGFMQKQEATMLFVAKKLAFVFAGSWHCSYMEENMPGNWGVTYMPQVNGKTSSDLGGNGVFAYSGTKYPKAAAIFMEYLASEEGMREFCQKGNFIPVRQSLIEGGVTFSEFGEEMQTFMNIVSTIDPKMALDETSPRFQQLNVIFSEQMDPLVLGQASPQQAAAEMKTQMEQALAE